jgi:uncharacterized membrane protein
MSRGGRRWQLGFLMAGVLIASYLTLLHYDAAVPLVCSNRGFIDCESVLTSPESRWFGLPVSLYGLVWFVGYGVVVWRWPTWTAMTRGLATLGAVTVIYLVFVEFIELHTLCLWCSSLHLIILGVFGIELGQWATWQEDPLNGTTSTHSRVDAGRKTSNHSESL